jgi:hypothetical protein
MTRCGTKGAQSAIHVFVELQLESRPYAQPHGGQDGESFTDSPLYSAKLIALYIKSGAFIDDVKPIYDVVDLPKHDGDGGSETTITFEPGEYITAI